MAVDQSDAGSTQPQEPHSLARGTRLALHFVYPKELDGFAVRLAPGIELVREAHPMVPDATGPTSGRGQVVIPHPTVSRRHARIVRGPLGPLLEDLRSSNGTRVQGQALTVATPIGQQAVVRFGDTIAVVDEEQQTDPGDALGMPPGRSPRMARLRREVARAAADGAPVLVTGETGTGKELLASEIHARSGRKGAYSAVNCAELSRELVESQLFGHVRGAFTGATAAHDGLFVAAD